MTSSTVTITLVGGEIHISQKRDHYLSRRRNTYLPKKPSIEGPLGLRQRRYLLTPISDTHQQTKRLTRRANSCSSPLMQRRPRTYTHFSPQPSPSWCCRDAARRQLTDATSRQHPCSNPGCLSRTTNQNTNDLSSKGQEQNAVLRIFRSFPFSDTSWHYSHCPVGPPNIVRAGASCRRAGFSSASKP